MNYLFLICILLRKLAFVIRTVQPDIVLTHSTDDYICDSTTKADEIQSLYLALVLTTQGFHGLRSTDPDLYPDDV